IRAGYEGRAVLDGVDLEVGDGAVLTLLGPSGTGKSTLLRVIAGLTPPEAGRVLIDGEDVTDLPAHRRRVGLMPQGLALFPHLDVAGNVGFGPRMAGEGPPAVARLVDEALALVDLADAHARDVTTLSGGEQQRVALARTIAARPRLLLLDEPLGSLDRALRRRLLDDLPAVFARLGVTVVTVTHDQDEALALADVVAVMLGGRVARVDAPERLWDDPGSLAVARFLGVSPLLPVTVHAGRARTPLGDLPAPGVDRRAVLALLPGALSPADAPGPSVRATVRARRFAGDHIAAEVDIAQVRFRLDLPRGTTAPVGARLDLRVDPGRLRWLDLDDGADRLGRDRDQ
ncbi:MAG: Fe(3+) ions import ATP-binding protein FbpC, partial [Actinomycetota bacterium]